MEKRDIAIIGTGGMAREVRWVIDDLNRTEAKWNVLGWVSKEEPGSIVAGLPVLGDDDWLLSRDKQTDVVVAVSSGELRKRIVDRLKQNKNITFPSIAARSAEISDSVKTGEGAVIMNQSLLTVDIVIGDFFLCNYGVSVSHDCRFGDYVTLNPGARVAGNVHIGECSTVGMSASVIQGLTIGKNVTVGAGAAVIRDVEDGCTVVGVPAKPLS